MMDSITLPTERTCEPAGPPVRRRGGSLLEGYGSMPVAKVRGELHCYNCGYVAAKFEGERSDGNLLARLITPSNGPGVRLRRGAPPRCGRCGGRLFIEDVEVVRPSNLSTEAPIVPLGSLFFGTGDGAPT